MRDRGLLIEWKLFYDCLNIQTHPDFHRILKTKRRQLDKRLVTINVSPYNSSKLQNVFFYCNILWFLFKTRPSKLRNSNIQAMTRRVENWFWWKTLVENCWWKMFGGKVWEEMAYLISLNALLLKKYSIH